MSLSIWDIQCSRLFQFLVSIWWTHIKRRSRISNGRASEKAPSVSVFGNRLGNSGIKGKCGIRPICIRPKLAIRRGITALVRDGWGINEISFGSKSVHFGHMKINFYWPPLSQAAVMATGTEAGSPRDSLGSSPDWESAAHGDIGMNLGAPYFRGRHFARQRARGSAFGKWLQSSTAHVSVIKLLFVEMLSANGEWVVRRQISSKEMRSKFFLFVQIWLSTRNILFVL